MRRLPFTLALLPGGPWSGTVEVRARAPGGFLVRTDFSGPLGRITEVSVLSAERLHDLTGVDLALLESA